MDKKLSIARKEKRKKYWNEVKSGRVLRARPGAGNSESVQKSSPPSKTSLDSNRGLKSKNVTKSPPLNTAVYKHSSPGKPKNSLKNVKVKKDKEKDVTGKHKTKSAKSQLEIKTEKTKQAAKTVQDSTTENGSPPEQSAHMLKKYVLLVGNLPFSVTKQQVEDHFRKTGGVKAVRIPKERGTDKGKGFAYVEFNSNISHRIALRLHQTTLAGRKINVEFTSPDGKSAKKMEQ